MKLPYLLALLSLGAISTTLAVPTPDLPDTDDTAIATAVEIPTPFDEAISLPSVLHTEPRNIVKRWIDLTPTGRTLPNITQYEKLLGIWRREIEKGRKLSPEQFHSKRIDEVMVGIFNPRNGKSVPHFSFFFWYLHFFLLNYWGIVLTDGIVSGVKTETRSIPSHALARFHGWANQAFGEGKTGWVLVDDLTIFRDLNSSLAEYRALFPVQLKEYRQKKANLKQSLLL